MNGAASRRARQTSKGGFSILSLHDDDMLDVVYEEILRPAFPVEELETLDVMRRAIRSGPDGSVGLYAIDEERALGCIVLYPFAKARVLLLGYIASRPRCRSRGIGSALFVEAKRRWFGDGQFDLVLAEVDDPVFYRAVGDIDPVRRVAFYDKLGAEVVAGPYFQPRVRSDAGRAYDIMLVTVHIETDALVPDRAVKSGQLVAFLEEYFDGEPSVSSADDVDRRWLIDWYRSRESVGLVALRDYRLLALPRPPSRTRKGSQP